MARAFGHIDQMVLKISQGQGSAAKFINDPRLYEALNDVSQNLVVALEDFRKLIEIHFTNLDIPIGIIDLYGIFQFP